MSVTKIAVFIIVFCFDSNSDGSSNLIAAMDGFCITEYKNV